MSGEFTRSRREYTEWDYGYAIFTITLGIIDFIFFMIGILYNELLYQILSYIFASVIFVLIYLFIKGKIPFKKNTEDFSAASKKEIFNFLKINAQNAYTAETLLKNLYENIDQSALQKYIKKNYEKILSELISGQYIQLSQKDGQSYYSFPNE